MRIARVACLFAVLVFAGSGCSWFRGKHESAASSAAAQPVAAEPAQGPAAVAMDFMAMHQKLGNSGLPQRADLPAYDAFLCPALAQAIRAAQVRQEQARAEHPDDKPPFVEGDLFSSLFEGPDGFEVRDTAVTGAAARVEMAMSNGQGEAARHWKDTLDLTLDDGIWCISDVEYGGQWPFANKGRLSSTLAP